MDFIKALFGAISIKKSPFSKITLHISFFLIEKEFEFNQNG